MPYILYGDPSSKVVYIDSSCYFWAPGGNPQTNAETSRASINLGYASSYVDYLFGGSGRGS